MSGFSSVAHLIAPSYSRDENGVPAASEAERMVFVNPFSTSSKLYDDAGASGHHPEADLQIRSCDYRGEPLCRFEGVVYKVESARKAGRGEFTRLALEKVTGDE